MLRVCLQIVLPFLAPFVVFFAYRLLVTRGQRLPRAHALVPADRLPALVLACASLVSLAFTGGAPPGGDYVPPHIEDGRIVPGAVRPPDGGDG